MVTLYERIAGALEVYVALSLLIMGVHTWHARVGSVLYNGLIARAYFYYSTFNPKVTNAHNMALVYVVISSISMLRQVVRFVLRSPPIPKTPIPPSLDSGLDRILFSAFPFTLALELMLSLPKYCNLFDVQSRRFQQRLTEDGRYTLDFACIRIMVGVITSLVLAYSQLYDLRPSAKLAEALLHFLISSSYLVIMLTGDIPNFEFAFGLHLMVGVASVINYFRILDALQDDTVTTDTATAVQDGSMAAIDATRLKHD